MKRIVCILLAASCILTGCSKEEEPQQTVQVQNGYPTAEEAYHAYLDVCLAGDKAAMNALFSADEKAAAPKMTAESLDLSEEKYASYTDLLDDATFQSYLDEYFGILKDSRERFGEKGSTWTMLPGSELETGEQEIEALSEQTGLDVQGLVHYNYYFMQEQKEDGAGVAGKLASVIELNDKWYPSFIFEIRPETAFTDDDQSTAE